MNSELKHTYVETNGITLHVVQAGPEEGQLLILLHGFPEFWFGWRHQISAMAEAGFRVWVPDQRGYNLSQKPEGIAAYNLDELAADIIGLIDAAGEDRATLVGHDWGGAVAWWTANKYPERLKKLAVLNVPHHAVMKRFTREDREQQRRSWYILFFQLPWLPEVLLRAGNGLAAATLLRRSSRPDTFSIEDLQAYRRAWMQPGAMKGMLNWYRALRRVRPQRLPGMRIDVPTLLIWGAMDVAFNRDVARPSIDLCDDGRLVFIEEATHWVQHEEPDRVNRLLLEFFSDE